MTGYHTFADDELVDADAMNGYVRDQVVTIFASTSARDSAISSPVHGQTCSVAPTGSAPTVYAYNANTPGWASISAPPPVYLWKTTSTARTDTATSADDSDFTLTLAANTTYIVDAHLLAKSDTVDTVDLRVAWGYDDGDSGFPAAFLRFCNGPGETMSGSPLIADAVNLGRATNNVDVVYGLDSSGTAAIHEHIVITTTARGATVTLQWAQGTQDADNSAHVYAGSHVRVETASQQYTGA